MIYYTYPTSARVVIERPSTLQRTLTLDDYLQLQLLLQHEHRCRHEREQQYRVAQALQNLKVLKDNYRRERAQRIQRYMDHYRRKALTAAAQDAVYRQWLACALEQRRSEEIWRQYEATRDYEQQQQQQAVEPASEEEPEEEGDKGFEDFHAKQLARILRLLFGQQDQDDATEQQVDEAGAAATDDDDESQAHDLWNYISHLQQQQDHDEAAQEDHVPLEEEEEQDESEQQEEQMSRRAIAPEPADRYEDIVASWPNQQQQQQKEPEPVHAMRATPDPPLQERVLSLKDLLDELVNAEHEMPAAHHQEQEQKAAYAPTHVVTAAEPATSNVDAAPQAVAADGATTTTATGSPEAVAEQRVHDIANQQKRSLPPSEPTIQHPDLLQIQQEMDNVEHDRLATVLKTPLQFKASDPGATLQLTATTPNNREFLGCEDAIMRTMLKLDTIDSHGNEKIRDQRRSLVKRAEHMLEKLDEHKEHEWQRTRKISSIKSKKRHRHHHPHRKVPVTIG